MKKKRLITLLGSICLVFVLVALPFMVACPAPKEEAPPEELVIGHAYGMTGPWISYTIPFAKCVRLQVERINEQGGITVGGKNYLINLVEVNTKCTPEGGVSACERLISVYGAKFIIGPQLSSASVAAVPLLMENKVFNISAVTTQKVLTPDSRYYFKAHFPGSLISRGYPEFIAERFPDIEKVAFVCPDDDAGYAEVEEFTTGLEGVLKKEPGRLEVVFEDYYPKGIEDHTPILTAALAKKPDIIHLGAAPPAEMSVIVKQARELGYTGWFTSGGGFTIDRLNEIAGKDFAYNIIHTSFDIDKPPTVDIPPGQEQRWKEFCDMFGDWDWLAKAWQEAYGEDLPGVVIYAAPAVGVMLQAIMAADSFDTDKVVDALEGMEYVPTIFGMGTWMGKETWGINHQIRIPLPVYEIRYGEQFPVEPPVLPAFYP